MKAILVGATGATGKDVLQLLLNDDFFNTIEIFVRKEPNVKHPKLVTHVIDFSKPEQWQDLVQGDVLFSALGTTLKAAGSKEKQWTIDYDYQYQFAKAAKNNAVPCYILVSAANANAKSSLFYVRIKGQLEEDVKALNFERTIIFQPPILIREDSDRSGEILGVKILSFLNSVGILKSQKPLSTKDLARAMVNACKEKSSGISVFEGQNIRKLLRK